jgi:hypothetical protein
MKTDEKLTKEESYLLLTAMLEAKQAGDTRTLSALAEMAQRPAEIRDVLSNSGRGEPERTFHPTKRMRPQIPEHKID